MARPKNTLLRAVVPLVVALAALGIAWSFFLNNKKKPVPGPVPPAPTATGTAPTPPAQPPPSLGRAQPTAQPTAASTPPVPAGTSAAPASPTQPAATVFKARIWTGVNPPPPLGSLEPNSPAQGVVEFALNGAGVQSLTLTRHFDDLKNTKHTILQESIQSPGGNLVSMAALGVFVNGHFVKLVEGTEGPVWRPVDGAPGGFEAEVLDDKDQPVLRVERRYSFRGGIYGLILSQRVTNVSGAALKISLWQLGPIDLPMDSFGYGGDKRRVRFGYLLGPTADPTRRAVQSRDFIIDHQSALGGKGPYPAEMKLWPNPKAQDGGYDLVWTGLTNRYFSVAVHTGADPSVPGTPVVLPNFTTVSRVVLPRFSTTNPSQPDPVIALRLESAPADVAPGATLDLSLGIYAGPMSRGVLQSDTASKALGLDGLVYFNFGGPCGFCTFDFVTGLLFWLLKTLHDYLVFDWALAIILLVVCVRTCLHPVTKWSQIRMQRFAKQMQGMAPKQKAIQERYKDDRKKLQEETARLWREEGISPMGALGCLPMFLQTPIWIALYATLYFAFDLRHQPAFFGVFQNLTSSNWNFLGDLAEPDRFLYFGRTIATLPILGPITSINILPLILGVVFFIHQKYLTPPPTTPLTPEQETQQKMIKVMTVVMFPLFMYNAPSGLALYFCANSTLGIFENKYIREHIDKYDLLTTNKNGKGKPSLFARVQAAALERARRVEEARKQPRGPRK